MNECLICVSKDQEIQFLRDMLKEFIVKKKETDTILPITQINELGQIETLGSVEKVEFEMLHNIEMGEA